MTTKQMAWLNGIWQPLAETRISPLDRGFLFGDGIYEVIPSYHGQPVGLRLHLQRLATGLAAIGITNPYSDLQWQQLVLEVIARNQGIASDGAGLAVYLHVSRGADYKRGHAFPTGITPTVFAYGFAIAPAPTGQLDNAKGVAVHSEHDLRWQRCQIKSTALLGNVLHHQAGVDASCYETILFNSQDELTEGSSCNVFIAKNGVVATPPLDQQILPGITRHILLQLLRANQWHVEERIVSRAEVFAADEVWLTSSSKELVPVIQLDKQPVGNGQVGPLWAQAQQLFARYRFDEFR